MGFGNADAAIRSLERFREKLNAIAVAAHDAGEKIDLEKLKEFIRAALSAEEHFRMMKEFPLEIDKLFEAGLKTEEVLKRLIALQDSPVLRPSDQFQGHLPTVEEQMTALRGGVGPGQSAGSGAALQGSEGRAWGELMSPQDTLRQRGIQGQGQVNLQEANAFADVLDATVKRFEAGFPNAYFTAVVLAMEIPYLRIGARSVAEARLYIQSFADVFLPGFQRALSEPGLSQLERSLTGEAIRILQTGSVSGGGGGGALTVPRGIGAPAPSETPPRQTTATRGGIGGATSTTGIGTGATTQPGGLGASPATQQDVAGVHSAIVAQTREVEATRNATVEANRNLAEGFRSINGWQQRVENGYLRPTHEGVVEVRRNAALGARQTQDLAQALERLELSGALTSGTTQ